MKTSLDYRNFVRVDGELVYDYSGKLNVETISFEKTNIKNWTNEPRRRRRRGSYFPNFGFLALLIVKQGAENLTAFSQHFAKWFKRSKSSVKMLDKPFHTAKGYLKTLLRVF